MSILNDSSIGDVTKTLEEIERHRRWTRFLRADEDAAEIAGCRQTLKQCVDNIMVGSLVVVRCLNDP